MLDYIFWVFLALISLFTLVQLFLSIYNFYQRDFLKGSLFLIWFGLKTYAIFLAFFFHVMIRAGGPPVDDYGVWQ